jgi:hypothetical protein
MLAGRTKLGAACGSPSRTDPIARRIGTTRRRADPRSSRESVAVRETTRRDLMAPTDEPDGSRRAVGTLLDLQPRQPLQQCREHGVRPLTVLNYWDRPSFRSDEPRVDCGPLYVSVCHGSHRRVFSLASRIQGAYEYPGRVTGQGKAKEIPGVSTRSLAKRPHQWYLSGSVSTTKVNRSGSIGDCFVCVQ